MKMFQKRPLSLILCIMLGGFSLFVNCSTTVKIIVMSCAVLFIVLTFIIGLISDGKRFIIRLFLILFIISAILGTIWSTTFYPSTYFNNECTISATVTEINKQSRYTYATLATETINGQNADYSVAAYIYDDIDLSLGDIIECKAKLITTGNTENSETQISYLKDGISAVLDDVSEIKVTGHKNFKIKNILISIRSQISDTLTERTNLSTGGFISALLIGERSHLDPDTSLSFRRIGISHILALSGMHLSILTLALERFLSILRLRKKPRIIISILFVLGYMSIAGFTPSITRSGIMLISYYILFLLARTRDTFTSLCISVALIVIIWPYAIFDVSLWLSAFATLGLVTAPMLNKFDNKNICLKALIWIINSFSASIFAIGATIVISATVFEQISLFSIISTLVFSPIITVFMYLSILLLFFGGIIPIGNLLIFIADFIKDLAELFARSDIALFSTNTAILKILIVIFALCFLGFLILDIKKRKRAIAFLVTVFLSIYLVGAINANNSLHINNNTYIKEELTDVILSQHNKEISFITPAKITKSYAYFINDILASRNLTKIDKLVLTSYSYNLDKNVQNVIDYIKTDTILLPYPTNPVEEQEAKGLSSALSLYGTNMRFYLLGDVVPIGNLHYSLIFRTEISKGNSECSFILKEGSYQTTYLTSGAANRMDYPTREKVSSTDAIIIGTSGRKAEFNLTFPEVESIIISSDESLSNEAKSYYKSINTEFVYVNEEYPLKKGRD